MESLLPPAWSARLLVGDVRIGEEQALAADEELHRCRRGEKVLGVLKRCQGIRRLAEAAWVSPSASQASVLAWRLTSGRASRPGLAGSGHMMGVPVW